MFLISWQFNRQLKVDQAKEVRFHNQLLSSGNQPFERSQRALPLVFLSTKISVSLQRERQRVVFWRWLQTEGYLYCFLYVLSIFFCVKLFV